METLYSRITSAAQSHGSEGEPDHEVGDLQQCLSAAMELLTDEQKAGLEKNSSVKDVLVWGEGETLGFKPGVYTLREVGRLKWLSGKAEELKTGGQVSCELDGDTVRLSRTGSDEFQAYIYLIEWEDVLEAAA